MNRLLEAIIGVLLLVIAVVVIIAAAQGTDMVATCEKKGGVILKAKDMKPVCIRKDSIIEIK